MALTWDPLVLPMFALALFDVAMAYVVLRARPTARQNQWLALFLFLFGLQATTFFGLDLLVTEVWEVRAVFLLTSLTWIAYTWAYLNFVTTLQTPWVRPLRTPLGRALLTLPFVALAIALLVDPSLLGGDIFPVDGGPHPWSFTLTTAGLAMFVFIGIVAPLVALGVAVSAYRRAGSRVERQQMFWYVVAFGLHDLVDLVVFGAGIPATAMLGWDPVVAQWTQYVGELLLHGGFPLLLAYGILRHQVLGIELTVKAGIEKSTVVAVFAVAFLVVSEGVERVLNVEGLLFGLTAAVVIGLVFRRVERLGEAVADRLMPGVEDTPAYRTERKLEIYRAAVEDAVENGELTAKERTILARLRDNLALGEEDASRIEADVVAGSAHGTGAR